jgi:alpha-D-ribose 1-methylphosphonate 5-triphosphate synthase subunit PhnH
MTNVIPPYTETESRTRANFLALMWALSYPGRPHALTLADAALPGALAGCVAVGETLLDLETSYYTPDIALGEALARTTARQEALETISRAEYLFFPTLSQELIKTQVAYAQVGTMLNPDQGATLVLGGNIGDSPSDGGLLRLSGPGIQGETTLRVGGIPFDFWVLRARLARYPLGWDVLIIDGDKVAGLPRSTKIIFEKTGG